jgi:polyether ionophore transport system permease protein
MIAALTGTRPLLKVALRQDLRNIAPWIGLISVLSASSILAYAWIFPDPRDRMILGLSVAGNPALSIVFGPTRNLMTADGFNAWRAGQLGAFFSGLMALLVVIRTSRAEEDSGQAELLAAGVLARQSRLAVAVGLAAIASVALGVVSFLVTLACGGGLVPTLVLSATFTASGLVFAGVAAVTGQIGADARAATGLAVAALGTAFVARGYIDSSGAPGAFTWLTPFGWLEKAGPATDNDGRPLLVAVGLAVVLVLAAFVLQTRRDFGQGLVASRPGPAGAGARAGVRWLAWKLNRGSLIAWLFAFACLGLIFGNLADSIGSVLAGNPAAAVILAASGGANPTFAFLITILQIIALVAAVAGVQVLMRLHSEEIDHRIDPLLAGSVRRPTCLAAVVAVAAIGSALAMLVAGVTLGLVAAARDDSVAAPDVVRQAMVTVPAVWVLLSLALAVVGAVPARRVIGWLGIVATFGLTVLGPTFRLPGWALDISPLRHVPDVTTASPDWAGLGALSLVVAGLTVAGFVGFCRRDIL